MPLNPYPFKVVYRSLAGYTCECQGESLPDMKITERRANGSRPPGAPRDRDLRSNRSSHDHDLAQTREWSPPPRAVDQRDPKMRKSSSGPAPGGDPTAPHLGEEVMTRRITAASALVCVFVVSGAADLAWTLMRSPTHLTCATWAIWGLGAGATAVNALMVWADTRRETS